MAGGAAASASRVGGGGVSEVEVANDAGNRSFLGSSLVSCPAHGPVPSGESSPEVMPIRAQPMVDRRGSRAGEGNFASDHDKSY